MTNRRYTRLNNNMYEPTLEQPLGAVCTQYGSILAQTGSSEKFKVAH
jgi:hypothetical protein